MFTPSADKLWGQIKVGEPDRCWLWQGKVNNKGYGYIGKKLAHRSAFESAIRPLATGEVVMHLCDNPPCCNPNHLRAGTQGDNIRDAVVKGRHYGRGSARGEAHHSAKLTGPQVVTIRERHANGETILGLSRAYKVRFNTIWGIVHYVTWKHIGGAK